MTIAAIDLIGPRLALALIQAPARAFAEMLLRDRLAEVDHVQTFPPLQSVSGAARRQARHHRASDRTGLSRPRINRRR